MSQKSPNQIKNTQTAILLENISVRFRLPSQKAYSFKESVIQRVRGNVRYRDHWALRDINLSINQQEIVGIIGPNGAGKTTLLRVIARILKPTTGRVRVVGKVAPLLGIGAGFHPELTGRENVFLNGSLLGFTHPEMTEKFARIVDFADLWSFINAPLRTYSSGMRTRLGFAVATDTQPDILIIDEVLGVGDANFREKSTARMLNFFEQGTTILLVTHSLNTIKELCKRVILIEQGRISIDDNPNKAIGLYLSKRKKKKLLKPIQHTD